MSIDKPVNAAIESASHDGSHKTANSNFHIFYSLLAGASESLAQALYLNKNTAASFAYLGYSPRRMWQGSNEVGSTEQTLELDRQRFGRILRCMDLLGVDESERKACFSILAAILWMGNLTFEDNKPSETGEPTGLKEQVFYCIILYRPVF